MYSLPEKWQVRLIQILAIPGLLVSFYLLLYHTGNLVIVCTPGSWDDCSAVSGPNAPFSKIGPVPVALIGLVGFAIIFMITWLPEWISRLEDFLPELLLGTTGMAIFFIAGLTALELFVIHAFCRYCLVTAGIVVLMFILAISFLRAENREMVHPTKEGQGETGTGQRLDVA